MRVERMHVDDKYDAHASCPICGRETLGETVRCEGAFLTADGRYRAWIAWLQKMDLTPVILKRIYHLEVENFFAELDSDAGGGISQL